ncbi:hypothetical protein MKK55_23895 [Methylobacterium sp. J-059]|uniref:hypothetical protein n=1 Tax=Methylobacterium sp. J-059 TaxID=2836643 RepID=UPI001FBA3F44|nr:hypothetical protein [Methylobacterium sp. J-059]MCJ2041973.1 hypothetical protein [Methylobacterium sp. J-059]
MWEWLRALPPGPASFVGTLTGSSIGLIAILVGALWNFNLSRKRDALERAQEVRSIAAALYGEMLLIRKEAASVARAVAYAYVEIGTKRYPGVRFDHHFLERFRLTEPLLYKSLASRLGELPSDIVISIAEFYSNYEEVKKWLPLIMDDDKRGFSYSPTAVLVPAVDTVIGINPTLRLIENLLHIRTPVADPDLGKTNSVIEMIEDQHADD